MGHRREQRLAIEKQFRAIWNNAVKVKFKNDKTDITKGEHYATLSILTLKGKIVSISNTPRRRYPGVVNIRIFAPEGEGSKKTEELLELAETAFYDDSSGKFVGRRIASGDNGLITFTETADEEDEGLSVGYFITVLRCPFYRDQQGA